MLWLQKEPVHGSVGPLARRSVEPDHGRQAAATEPRPPVKVKNENRGTILGHIRLLDQRMCVYARHGQTRGGEHARPWSGGARRGDGAAMTQRSFLFMTHDVIKVFSLHHPTSRRRALARRGGTCEQRSHLREAITHRK